MRTAALANPNAALPRVSPTAVKLFGAFAERFVRRRFHSVRILRKGLPEKPPAGPLVIYLNHAAWWDPLVCLLLSREFFPTRSSFAPIDAAMFDRYAGFKHLGFFPVKASSASGARAFLETTGRILATSTNALWLTPQGRFMDVRERPLSLQGGLAALARRAPDAAFVPLAIEYAFWTEPRPEILVSFGKARIPNAESSRSAEDCTRMFADALESAQDELAAGSCRRDASEWLTLSRGAKGIHCLYDAGRWLRARVRGEEFARQHHWETAL